MIEDSDPIDDQLAEENLSEESGLEVVQEADSPPETSDLDENVDSPHNLVYLSGLYKNWFLDYASYVILERAVPHIYDGLKPVHRRILHSMKLLDDGRYNKVANLIGHTMQFHPHGDASIGDALVQLGQKELLIDTQGNWGNIFTGDGAAAPRYIEARLTKFALEVVYNAKTTFWKSSYDGRNKEPVALPAKYPLLLAMGAEGIAVGLASKILPHNFNEIIDAAICCLKNKPFELFPDFPTYGLIDVSKYNDGLRGGKVRIRAKIDKVDNKTLIISEVPFGKTTGTLIDSIISANDKGKIKIKKIDDNTSDKVEVIIQLQPGTSSDKTIDALYAFTDCEISLSPNMCVIQEDKPIFTGVTEILQQSVYNTIHLLRRELEIRKGELEEELHFSSLEQIFIEKRIYRDIEECETWEAVIKAIDDGLTPYKKLFIREVSVEDITKLTEIKIKRISKYDSKKADERINEIKDQIAAIQEHLSNITEYTIEYFKNIKKKYGKDRERRTEIRNFENIVATKVVAKNEKLYVDRKEGFIGIGLKKEEYICECSDIDDVIVFKKDGKYQVVKVADKIFVGKNILHIAIFKKDDERTIYNLIYRDGKNGSVFIKRFAVTSISRDKEYDVTKGTEGSKILYMSVNPNGEAEVVRVYLKPRPMVRKLIFEFDFSELTIKGRNSLGNILSKNEVHKIIMKEKGVSTLGGRKIWFDEDVFRLNTDARGKYIGQYTGDEKILVITNSGFFRTTSFELSNHYEDDVVIIEKFKPEKVFSAVFYDADKKFTYVKRFNVEDISKKMSLLGENPESALLHITSNPQPEIKVDFGGKDRDRESELINVTEFVGIKGYKAKGKRLSDNIVKSVIETNPVTEDNEELDEESDAISHPNNSEAEDDETSVPTVGFEPGNPDDENAKDTNEEKAPSLPKKDLKRKQKVRKKDPLGDVQQMKLEW